MKYESLWSALTSCQGDPFTLLFETFGCEGICFWQQCVTGKLDNVELAEKCLYFTKVVLVIRCYYCAKSNIFICLLRVYLI